jgi:hypothetical protein
MVTPPGIEYITLLLGLRPIRSGVPTSTMPVVTGFGSVSSRKTLISRAGGGSGGFTAAKVKFAVPFFVYIAAAVPTQSPGSDSYAVVVRDSLPSVAVTEIPPPDTGSTSKRV